MKDTDLLNSYICKDIIFIFEQVYSSVYLTSIYSSDTEERNLNVPEQRTCRKNIEMTKLKDSETLTMHHYKNQDTLYFYEVQGI